MSFLEKSFSELANKTAKEILVFAEFESPIEEVAKKTNLKILEKKTDRVVSLFHFCF